MKYVIVGIVATVAVYLSWPYAYLYRIDKALTENDHGTLNRLVDLTAVRAEIGRNIIGDRDVTPGADTDGVLGWLKGKVREFGEHAIEESIDLSWVTRTLTAQGPFRRLTTHAFFESWDEFVIRLGSLGNNPVHVRMTLVRGNWRITAIYQ